MNSHYQPIKRVKLTLKQMVLTSLMAAILFVSQVALASIPNIEIVSLLLILYTICFSPRQSIIAVYIFCVLQGLMYGFGIWWIMYLYVWPILVLVSWLFKNNNSVILWAIISGAFGLFFGALCAIPYLFILGINGAIAWWISGIPYDIAHCLGNIIVILVLFKPMRKFFFLLNNKLL